MDAARMIELIKQLPPDGRAEVLAFVRGWSEAEASSEVSYIPEARFVEVAPQVFAKHRELMRKLAQ